MANQLIALLTDFGVNDPYVGIMKGVIHTRCPETRLVDITHGITPQNVREASYVLRASHRYFPAHTIFLVVVDPGVGMDRQGLAIKTDHGTYVGPDNGVFGGVLQKMDTWHAAHLMTHDHLSPTFHGRDLFAPVAADLACGAALHEVGSPTVDINQEGYLSYRSLDDNMLEGEVIHIDRFGNAITSVGEFAWENEGNTLRLDGATPLRFDATTAEVAVSMAGALSDQPISRIQTTYGKVSPGTLLALISSDGQLEIAVNQGNAAAQLGLKLGTLVRLRLRAASSR